jgi:hypothetical protein
MYVLLIIISTKKSFIKVFIKMNICVLLFLAHDGVYHPQLWETWKQQSLKLLTNTEILFKVHAPSTVNHNLDFCTQYAILNADSGSKLNFGNSGWCDLSLVWQYIKALHHILQDPIIQAQEDVKICLVSGSDIPFKNGAKVLNEPFFHSDQFCNFQEGHSQWISITKETALKLDEEFFRSKSKFKQIYQKMVVKDFDSCPDETFLLFFSAFQPKNNKCTTYDLLRPGLESPMEWTSFEEPNHVVFFGPRKYLAWSLKTALLFASIETYSSTEFAFRKVMSTVIFTPEIIQEFFITNLWNPNISIEERIRQFNSLNSGMKITSPQSQQYINPLTQPLTYKQDKRGVQKKRIQQELSTTNLYFNKLNQDQLRNVDYHIPTIISQMKKKQTLSIQQQIQQSKKFGEKFESVIFEDIVNYFKAHPELSVDNKRSIIEKAPKRFWYYLTRNFLPHEKKSRR